MARSMVHIDVLENEVKDQGGAALFLSLKKVLWPQELVHCSPPGGPGDINGS